jgi:hypothetical protein
VRFAVVKYFLDENPGDVRVNLVCNTGLDREQSATISGQLGDNLVVFVVEEMVPVADPDLYWCEITETDQPAGYVPLYIPFELDPAATPDQLRDLAEAHHGDYPTSCRYEGIEGPDDPNLEDLMADLDHVGPIRDVNFCLIVNVPHPVEVDVTKTWDITGVGGEDYDTHATIRAKAKWIKDADKCRHHGGHGGADDDLNGDWDCKYLDFDGDDTKSFYVWPYYNPGDDDVDQGIGVYFKELLIDDAFEVDNTCGGGSEGSIRVRVGDTDAGCTFHNVLFFEGIPTLSRYGLALLALLMLGMGAVAFRRIV